jgi:hypothetical protein
MDNFSAHTIALCLRKLATDLQIEHTPCFEPYAEPRYRSALQLRFEQRAAIGGVLRCADAAHVRIFLDAWQYHKGK